MGLKIEYPEAMVRKRRAGAGKSGNPHMEGQHLMKRGKWDPKTKRYAPKVIDAEKVIKDKKKPYRKPKKPTGVKRKTGPRGIGNRKKK